MGYNKRKLIHKGRIFDFFTENVTLPNGEIIDLDIIRHPGASAVVPVTDDGKVVLIKQFRYAAGGFIWEIPAGVLEQGESPELCAKRELIEETGYAGKNFKKLSALIPGPGYADEVIHIFLATGLVPAKQQLDSDEVLDVHEIEFDTAIDMIYNGDIQDAKTMSGLLMAKSLFKTVALTKRS